MFAGIELTLGVMTMAYPEAILQESESHNVMGSSEQVIALLLI